MGIVYSSVFDTPIDQLFAWHARPGAIVRLTPPWQPIRAVEEAGSLRDGRAVLALPGGLRWVAQHDPDAYDPPNRFVDELSSMPLRAVVSWRHSHEFHTEADHMTRITDRVDTPVPRSLLRATFAYRHRQLRADLIAHRWASQYVKNH